MEDATHMAQGDIIPPVGMGDAATIAVTANKTMEEKMDLTFMVIVTVRRSACFCGSHQCAVRVKLRQMRAY